MNKAYKLPSHVIDTIAKAVAQIQYGYIQITVHDSKIVQIDKTEKIRFDADRERRTA